MSVVHRVEVGTTTPTEVCLKSWDSGAAIVQNAGSATVFVGDESVSADGSTPALSLEPGQFLPLPRGGSRLYAVVGSGSASLVVLELGNNGTS
jgi:hypothetical protein